MSRQTMPVEMMVPNDWNPNVMLGDSFRKLKNGMEAFFKNKSGVWVAPVVRKHPTEKNKYQIIDGEHRWRAAKELGRKEIEVDIVTATDAQARVLTSTLNYLKGEPDIQRLTEMYDQIKKTGMSIEEMSELLPESKEEITAMFEEFNIHIEDSPFSNMDTESINDIEERDQFRQRRFAELKFYLSESQIEFIDKEISRVAKLLGSSKNQRGRALEMIAAMASGISDEEIKGFAKKEGIEIPVKVKKGKKAKAEGEEESEMDGGVLPEDFVR